MTALLANVVGPIWGYSIGEVAIALIVILGILGIAYLCAQEAGIAIPPFFIRVLWIVLAVVVAVVAIRFLMSL